MENNNVNFQAILQLYIQEKDLKLKYVVGIKNILQNGLHADNLLIDIGKRFGETHSALIDKINDATLYNDTEVDMAIVNKVLILEGIDIDHMSERQIECWKFENEIHSKRRLSLLNRIKIISKQFHIN